MSVIDRLRRGLANMLGVNRTVSSLTNYFTIGSTEVYIHIDTQKAIDEGYNGNTAVYAIVNTDAEKFASIPAFVYAKDDEDKVPQENELSKLLNKPNDYQGADSFFMLARAYRLVTGEAFIWLNRGVLADEKESKERLSMPVLEMYVLPSDHVIIKPDPTNVWGIQSYLLDAGGQRLPIPKEDIIHWKNISLLFDASTRSHLRGQSPLSSGYKTLQANNSATDSEVRSYQNDGAKGVLYNETMENLDPAQKVAVEGVIQRKINSNAVKESVATLAGKWGYLDLGKSNTDLALLEGKTYSMKELCFLFGVPYELFDSETTYANKEQAQKGWVTNRIIPSTKQLADELNRVLLQAFDLEGKQYIAFDPTDLPELQEDMKLKIETMMAGPFVPNDILEAQGYDRSADPLMEQVWMKSGFQPINQISNGMDEVERRLNEQGLDD